MFRSSNSQALVRLAHCDCIPSIHFARVRILFQKIGPQIKKLDKIVLLARNNFVLQQKFCNTIASTPLLCVQIAVRMTGVIKRDWRGNVIVDVLLREEVRTMHEFFKYTRHHASH